jgi:hypothetical protein
MAASSGAGVLLVYCKGQVAATSLFIITLTGHVTLVISQFSTTNQGIATEALPAILSTCHAESLLFTISDAFRVGDLVLANVGESDAAENTVPAAEFVRKATIVRPSCNVGA